VLGIFESDSEIQLARTVTWPGPVLELTMTGERRRPQARAGPPGHRDSGSARGALRHASPCCHRLSGGCDLARVRHRSRESAAGVGRRVLRPLTFPSRLQAATVGAIVDSALQSADTGSTTGCQCGRLGGLGRHVSFDLG
jgi:hypothetical protein